MSCGEECLESPTDQFIFFDAGPIDEAAGAAAVGAAVMAPTKTCLNTSSPPPRSWLLPRNMGKEI